MRVCRCRMGMVLWAVSLILMLSLPGWAAEPLWRENPGTPPPPEIARLNDFMNGLAERLKPPSSKSACGGRRRLRPRGPSPATRRSDAPPAPASSSERMATWSPTRMW